MPIFGAFGVAGSAVTVHRKWLDAVADNLANINTVRRTDEDAFQAKYIVAQAADYGSGSGGVRVAGVELGSAEGRLAYEPDHPLADEDGYVRYPDTEMSQQMTQLIMAQRGYQANVAVIDRAKGSAEAAINLGRA